MRITAHHRNAFGCTSGPWSIWSLSDGYVDLPAASLKDPEKEGPGEDPLSDEQVRLSVNCFLLQCAGQDTILIDCGAGGSWDATMGHLGQAFEQAGIYPSDVRLLMFTHAHNDHINGLLTRDGDEAFPSLDRILIPEQAIGMFEADAGLARFRPRLTPIKDQDQLGSELRATALPGHAAGHTGYRFDTSEDRVLFCGDVVHVPAAQFTRPELTWAFDEDQALARSTRLRVLKEAAASGTWLAGAHLGRPGIGRVFRDGGAYKFQEAGSCAGALAP